MKFHAYHGCLQHEKEIGNTFLVSLELKLNTAKAEQTDNLDDTLNYQLVYDAVRNEMSIPSDLIEHVGRRIVDRLLNHFSELEQIKIELEKLSPPLGGDVERVAFVLDVSR